MGLGSTTARRVVPDGWEVYVGATARTLDGWCRALPGTVVHLEGYTETAR